MGYTPLFSSLTTGTLCGKWPDIGLWPVILSMADKHGVVDVTPAYIASVTGLQLEEVIACMTRFCSPDPYSRTKDADGARLALIDEHRDWGWQIVNHERYREKARKASYDAQRVATGENRERMRTRADPRRPALIRVDPLSDSNADSNADREPETRAREAPRETRSGKPEAERAAFTEPVPRETRSVEAGEAYRESLEAWRSEPGLSTGAMERWLAYCAGLDPPKVVQPLARLALARTLSAMGSEVAQDAAVDFCIMNGWRNLRQADGKATGSRVSASDRVTWRPDPDEDRRAMGVA